MVHLNLLLLPWGLGLGPLCLINTVRAIPVPPSYPTVEGQTEMNMPHLECYWLLLAVHSLLKLLREYHPVFHPRKNAKNHSK